MTDSPTRASVGLRSERGPILLALMISTALVALDATILSTAVPSIVADLGGFEQFPWLFSIYLLSQAVSVPLYGKLSDVIGRKPIMLIGIGLFLVGSLLCGLAWSMPALIAFRALQGLGAGAIQPMGITIAGDIYTVAERAKTQGYLASVWGISSVVGPTLGGVLSDLGAWRWIFLVNIPLCLLAAFLLIRSFRETTRGERAPLDVAGASVLALGTALLILGLLEGGNAWPWLSAAGVGVFVVSALAFAAFVAVERRAAAPVLPLWVLTRRVLLSTSLVSVTVGAITLGVTSYFPTFAQNVLGSSALGAGFAVAAMTLGWPVAASLSGRLYLRIGFRRTAFIGAALVTVGTGLTILLGASSSLWEIAGFCVLIGAGMGLVATPTLIRAQASVEWNERGVVSSTNFFARNIGSAVAVAVFGAIVNAQAGGGDPTPEGLADGTRFVCIALTVLAVGMLFAVRAMPKDGPRPAEAPAAASTES
ncbi:MFS transporter [Rathayibacter sp. VKM Ac-2856]|uniref:MDR family MFS transporter n=1 Tax=unclassified Rathayibacter TaxID=2609250 RepID=UPI001563277B|nr:MULTISPECIES: MDR family MFS transporter [unclassified Rathayibacter]NQX03784.1 MFS transporter [Rathayibacter sp. VKM Ac-2858]NQX18952.1 MFS transporter [Rathayibacter sp. VKM Ac-2856]